MTLPVSGTIALSQVNTELGKAAAAAVSLNEAAVRTLAGKPSGTISMSDLHGKSAVSRVALSYVFSVHSANPVPNVSAMPGYIAGKSDITITVNPGIYIYSDSATPALNIVGGAAGDTIKLVNNGFIMGKGGNGSYWSNPNNGYEVAPTPGYTALQIAYPITIDNQNGYIGGGGGAGGGLYSGGGGAGGGRGSSYLYPQGGAGGGLGGGGGNGGDTEGYGSGGGGGRIMPGTGGGGRAINGPGVCVGLGGGSGGGGGIYTLCGIYPGGGGGGWGAAGGPAPWSNDGTVFGTAVSGAGGSSNGAGGNSYFANGSSVISNQSAYPGSAGGKAINTQGQSVTLVGASGSRIFGIMG